MSFLAPFLLALSAFASIPILLHLIRRKRVRVLELPTFQYLKRAAEQQRVRFHLQDQLLMLLRILILLLVALAFAGPLGGQRSGVTGPVLQPKNLLILDDTVSMAIRTGEESTAYGEAQRFVLDLLWESGADWQVGLASDFLGKGDPDEFLANGYEDTVDLLERHPSPEAQGSIQSAIDKARTLLDNQTSLWVVSDAAEANWEEGASLGASSPIRIELIEAPVPSEVSNWALTELSLNNQPLLEDEPALLSGRVSAMGNEGGQTNAPLVRYGVHSRGGTGFAGQYQPPSEGSDLSGPHEFTFRSTIPTEGVVSSVSASLVFPDNSSEAFNRDNQATLIPRLLEGVRVLVVTESEEWGGILQAALVGFDTNVASGKVAPPADAAEYSSYVLLLEGESPASGWRDLLEQRVRSGAGALVFYDAKPDSVRIENWTQWWGEWGTVPIPETVDPGDLELKPGADEWFFDSLDPTAIDPNWLEGEIPLVALDGWTSEMDLVSTNGTRTPVFQTHEMGDGTVAAWGIPLSPNDTALVYSTAWVPLLSQMVKRTLVDPATLQSDGFEGMRVESNLASLSEDRREELGSRGYRFYSMDEVASRVGNLSQSRWNWTPIILALCLMLAVVEIGVSNRV
ncbi:MAG: BatA domain-containing protein [Candidatus Omnitrophica bacterium]|nr:BatA domain-containing protein [Candidatus Omnitrophota bacterium]